MIMAIVISLHTVKNIVHGVHLAKHAIESLERYLRERNLNKLSDKQIEEVVNITRNNVKD